MDASPVIVRMRVIEGNMNGMFINNDQNELKEGRQRASSLVVNAVSNWWPQVTTLVVGYFLMPYLLSKLGKSGFGMWVLVGSFIGYYGLLRLGVGGGLMRYVPFYVGRGDYEAACGVFSTAVVFFGIIGIVTAVVSLFAAGPIADFYEGGPELAGLIRLIGLAAAVECLMRVLDATMRAREKWVVANTISVIHSIMRAAGIVVCLYLGYGIIGMGYVVLGVTLLSIVLIGYYFLSSCPLLNFDFSLVKLSHMKDLIFFGSLLAIATVLWSMTPQAHGLIVGKIVSLEAVAIYAIAALPMKHVHAALVRPNQVFFPRFAYLDGSNSPVSIRPLMWRTTLYNAILTSGIILLVVVAVPAFVRLWLPTSFEESYPVMKILAAGYLVDGSMMVNSFLLSGTGRQGVLTAFAFVEGALGITLSIILGLRLGLVGVAGGFLLSVVLLRGLIVPWYANHLVGGNILRYFLRCILRPWAVLLVMVTVSHLADLSGWAKTWPRLFFLAAGIELIYMVFVYWFALDSEQRRDAVGLLKQVAGHWRVFFRTGGRAGRKRALVGQAAVSEPNGLDGPKTGQGATK